MYRATEDVVKIFLADGRRVFLHRSFACHHSLVLREAFKRPKAEGANHAFIFEVVDSEIFSFFVEWLYTQKLELSGELGVRLNNKNLVQLWVVGDKLAVPRFQNLVIDRLHEIYKRDATISTVNLRYVYDNTSEGSALRRFFVNLCTYDLDPQVLQLEPQHLPPEMLLELAASTRSLLKTRWQMPNEDARKFHVDAPDA